MVIEYTQVTWEMWVTFTFGVYVVGRFVIRYWIDHR